MLLALLHIYFPAYFKWKTDLQSLTLVNKQMMVVHTFFIGVIVFLMGVLCLCCTEDLLHTELGHQISLGISFFWAMRLIFQFFVYSPRLWKGKRFETAMHMLFSLLWVYLTAIFLIIFLSP